MDVETITKLLDAGYTKADIDAMAGAKSANENTGAENESAEKKGEESANEVKKTDEVAEMLKTLSDTVNGLTATVKAMQDTNAKGAHTDSPKASDAIKAAMDSFIEKL